MDIVIGALDKIEELYGVEIRQTWSMGPLLAVIFDGPPFIVDRAAFFCKLVQKSGDVNISITESRVDDNNLMHYVQSVEEAQALV